MKNLLKYIAAASFLLLGMTACDKEYEAPNAGAKNSVVYSSETTFANQVQVYGEISFGDVSSGVLAREWTVPEGIGYIVSDDSVAASDQSNIKVVFSEPGMHEVKLHQEFDGDFFVGEDVLNSSYDTTIMVTVLDSVSMGFTAHHINDDGTVGAELVLSDGAKNQVTASKIVRFTYLAEGAPQELYWTFGGGSPSVVEYDGNQMADGTADETNVQYKKIGTFDIQFIGYRDRPYGSDTIAFTDFIEVIPSTDPVTLDAVQDRGNMVELSFSREIDPNSVNATDFEVSIANGGVVFSPTVSGVSVDPNDGTLVLLTLEGERFYRDDVVTVSYTPGVMQTTDLVTADAFADVVMTFKPGTNVLAGESSGVQYDFEESADGNTNWPYQWWGAPWDQYTLAVGSVRAHSGNKSAKVTMQPAGGMIISNTDADGNKFTFDVKSGKTYEIGVWIYVESLGNIDDMAGEVPNLIFFYQPATNWGAGRFNFLSTTATGEWIYARTTFESFGADATISPVIRGSNAGNAESITFYMDDWTVTEVELRP
ncbi:hypothetical protein SAMN04488028_107149 [Reichenbachiella agariperforans]|uniref:PKD domain-containing protein n=1 Tax=Reichenbachiella agariperforans TaxID=156994 RepID=A0A1M6UJU9_REIAG|nr:hypothetical protein [Reichenbachiella agariperforans]SHK69388.1 hypothetical protein SAMN04488028_107149 [Reichenbachiella agariperforans]